MVRIKSTLKN